jgi:hypothetical protein
MTSLPTPLTWNIDRIGQLFNADPKHIDDIEEGDGFEFDFTLGPVSVILSFVPSDHRVLVGIDDGRWYLSAEGHRKPVLRGRTLTLYLETIAVDYYGAVPALESLHPAPVRISSGGPVTLKLNPRAISPVQTTAAAIPQQAG